MAEGGQDINSQEEHPSHGPEITVLSWNINGKSRCGMSACRNRLAPSVVGHVNPDVLLLQETKTNKLVDKIKEVRTYSEERAGNKSEARILYDPNVFEKMPEQVNLDDMVARVFPQDQQRQMRGARTTFRSRVAAVRLRHIETGKVIVFMSYHNVYTDVKRRSLAERFCQIVANNTESEDTLVVAGADLNCSIFARGQAHVPEYDIPQRRHEAMQQSGRGKKKEVIDYFVARQHDITTRYGRVSALDIINARELRAVRGALTTGTNGDFTNSERERYNLALDHDPLVYKLSLV